MEVDRLRCMVLDKLGFEVKHADFLQLKPDDLAGQVDAVLMNPPYAGRLWQDHFEHALQFVKDGGTVAGILPEGAVTKMQQVDGYAVEYSEVKRNQFAGVSIGVVYARLVKRGQSKPATAPTPESAQVDATGQYGLFEAA